MPVPMPKSTPVPVTIVVADDRPENRALVRAYVTVQFGAEVFVAGEAADGIAAVRLCEDLQPDVLVLDDDMPRLTGLGAMAALRRGSPDTFVILYSASAAAVQALHPPDRLVDKVAGLESLRVALAAGIDAARARRVRAALTAASG